MPLAASPKELAENLVQESQSKMQTLLSQAQGLKHDAELKVEAILKESTQNLSCGCNKSAGELEPSKAEKQGPARTLIFVSLSMPKESLKGLFKEAEQQQAYLVMRGLKNNSFKETAEILKEFQIGVSIDPALFEKYHIRAVPTFVKIDDKEPLVLKGNVTLTYANQKFKEAS